MIDCKFIKHGLTIRNNGVVHPCCAWRTDEEWEKDNHYSQISDISKWHNSEQVLKKREMLENGTWPDNCGECKEVEESGRYDSMRGNGNSSYYDYGNEDIFLEIRPGTVCNFACQSCDAGSSTRIRDFMHKAGLINKKHVDIKTITNFDFLNPISDRIKDVAILGGEPFYDKNCLKFLDWVLENVNANLIIFTNGLFINHDFLKKYKSKIILVFSIDAIEKPSDYIRYGSEWDTVKNNYFKCRQYSHVEVRLNVTTSVYNFCYLKNLIDFFKNAWPDIMSFSEAHEKHLQPSVIPLKNRKEVIESLKKIPTTIWDSNVPVHQKHNTANAVLSIIKKLESNYFDAEHYDYLCSYIKKMDLVKKIDIKEYCPELHKIIFS